jgi:hypothetical protein
VCNSHRHQFPVATTPTTMTIVTGTPVGFDRTTESRAARSLRRLYDARLTPR